MNIISIKVITPDNLGKGITFNPQTKQWEVQSGFDCAALSALPSKPWKKGTTLLAKQDGECIQLTALDSIFQEIGVGIAADKTSAFTGETYNVTVTVTNTGESKNELTNLTVQKPLLGNYEILDVRTSKQAVDEVETLDQLNYNLKGLAKGGTFILRFSVKANDVGTYQFSATVNPNSALDQNTKNNTDTIILKANTKIDTTYVPSVDCPAISLTDVESGVELTPAEPAPRRIDGREELQFLYPYAGEKSTPIRINNAYTDKTSLNGVKLKFSAPVTIASFSRKSRNGDQWNVADVTFRTDGSGVFPLADPRYSLPTSTSDIGDALETTDNQTFVFNKDVDNALIIARPRGNNCRWQGWYIHSATVKPASIQLTNVSGASIKRVPVKTTSKAVDLGEILTIPSGKLAMAYRGSSNTKPALVVKSGTTASATIDNPYNIMFAKTAGLVTITPTTITVDASATSADSIVNDAFDVIVED